MVVIIRKKLPKAELVNFAVKQSKDSCCAARN